MYHLWPEGEYPDILLVHTTASFDGYTTSLFNETFSEANSTSHKSEVRVQITHLEKDVSYKSLSHYCYIRCIASVHGYVLYYSCMLYDVYTGLVVQRSHYTHIVTTHHPHTITIITTYPKREQETQSQPHPPHRKADTEKITLF